MWIHRALIGVCAGLLVSAAAAAGDRGPVTNLPLPRFVSMEASEGNVRRGPSLTHRIDWVFKQKGVPLEITAEYGHWRRVRDQDGAGGWMHYALLSGVRTVVTTAEITPLRDDPDPDAMVVARLEMGVIARVQSCVRRWCRLSVAGYDGWSPKTSIWGVRPEEVFE